MKTLFVLLISLFCLSFCPSIEKTDNRSSSGFYIFVEDITNRSYQKFIVESKDSANAIFRRYFSEELELGEVQKPISIYNGDLNFYIARVTVLEKPNGKRTFRHLKYPLKNKRKKLRPVIL